MRVRPYDYARDGLQNPPYDQATDTGPVTMPEQFSVASGNRARVLGSLCACTALFSGIGLAGAAGTQEPLREGAPISPLGCKTAPTASDLQEVRRLFAADNIKLGLTASREAVAADYGLTVVNSFEATAPLYDASATTADGFTSMMTTANASLEPFDITLNVAGQKEAAREHVRPLEMEDLELLGGKTSANIIAIVSGITRLPVEYMQFSGIRRVVLFNDSRVRVNGVEPQAFTHLDRDGTVYYNLAYQGNDQVLPHETEHKVDARECGTNNAQKDPDFSRLNPVDVYQETDRQGYVALSDNKLKVQYDDLRVQQFSGKPMDKDAFCHLAQEAADLQSRVVSPTQYGLEAPTEDKAEIGVSLAFPHTFRDYLDPQRPILKKKFEMIMGRLYRWRPNLVRYFAAVGSRPPSSGDTPYQCD